MAAIGVLILFAYLLGSVPSGYVLGKLAGIDVRRIGSGNIGATNVARVIGKRQGILTLVADATKGFLPVMAGFALGFEPFGIALVAGSVFLGHLFPVFLNFKGGKGVATALGALLAIAPLATLILVVVFALIVFGCRIVSLGAIGAAMLAPLVLWLFYQPAAIVGMGVFFALMIVIRHRGNIQRLRAGTEPRFGAH